MTLTLNRKKMCSFLLVLLLCWLHFVCVVIDTFSSFRSIVIYLFAAFLIQTNASWCGTLFHRASYPGCRLIRLSSCSCECQWRMNIEHSYIYFNVKLLMSSLLLYIQCNLYWFSGYLWLFGINRIFYIN